MAKRVAIQETFSIPSRGKLYANIPEKFTLRAMTTVEEKMRLAGSGFETIPNIIKACTVEPKEYDVFELKPFDLQFLMYKLRIVTYGSEYKISLVCPNCGRRHEKVINLDEIETKYLDDDSVKEPIEIGPLPISGDVIGAKILSMGDTIEIEKEAKRILDKFPEYVGDPDFILSYQYRIQTVNGEPVPKHKIQGYVESMHARDMRFFDSKYNQVAADLGMDLIMTEHCGCGEDFDYRLPITSEFFRPEY